MNLYGVKQSSINTGSTLAQLICQAKMVLVHTVSILLVLRKSNFCVSLMRL